LSAAPAAIPTLAEVLPVHFSALVAPRAPARSSSLVWSLSIEEATANPTPALRAALLARRRGQASASHIRSASAPGTVLVVKKPTHKWSTATLQG
ncbi:hypothetical protein OC842_007643, partial [Tilletia horrida]